eukprot:TRINITY_DN37870_c0_g1_i1.p1 TRINITY_DN37870_c0_g1~~TRINITY_DN37870_c0_g1_i1.p1  ORF type:complete len:587 (+),score=119.37 TRINITY_DN37870_c0_g1_i1:49-1809(+)
MAPSCEMSTLNDSQRAAYLASADCVIADSWPICRTQLKVAMQRLGVSAANIEEVEDDEGCMDALARVFAVSAAELAESDVLSDAYDPLGACHSSGASDGDVDRRSRPLFVFVRRSLPGMTTTRCCALVRELNRRTCGDRRPHIVVSMSTSGGTFTSAEGSTFNCSSSEGEEPPSPGISSKSEGATADNFLPMKFTPDELRDIVDAFCVAQLSRSEPGPLAPPCETKMDAHMRRWRQRHAKIVRARRNPDAAGECSGKYGVQLMRSQSKRTITPEEVEGLLLESFPGRIDFSAKSAVHLGQGSQASVYLGGWREAASTPADEGAGAFAGSFSKVAIKVFSVGMTDARAFARELEVGKAIQHENLVRVHAAQAKVPFVIIQEYCEGGNLLDLLHSRSRATSAGAPTMEQRLKIGLDVARGMAALHEANVVHRDLKSENVLLWRPLLGADCVPHAKVADFGLARQVTEVPVNRTPVPMTKCTGSIAWMAPEVIQSGYYGVSADLYSYGVLFFELLVQAVPYKDSSEAKAGSLKDFVVTGGRPDNPRSVLRVLETAPSWAAATMREAWAQDPTKRPQFREIIRRFEEAHV